MLYFSFFLMYNYWVSCTKFCSDLEEYGFRRCEWIERIDYETYLDNRR